MKCATTRNNVTLNNKLTKINNKTRSNSQPNSLLTNAANMKITKAIANSKQNRKTTQQKGLTSTLTNHDLSCSYERDSNTLLSNRQQDSSMITKDVDINKEPLLAAGQGKKESFSQMARNSLNSGITVTKEIDYLKEQRSPTTNTSTHMQGTTTIYPGATQQTREHNTQRNNSNSLQALQNNNNTAAINSELFLRSAETTTTNLNLSSLAGKTPQFISVVNEQSNQTVLRTTTTIPIATTTTKTTIATTTNEADNGDKNPLLCIHNNNNNNRSHDEVTATTLTNKTTITAIASTITAYEDHEKSDLYQQQQQQQHQEIVKKACENSASKSETENRENLKVINQNNNDQKTQQQQQNISGNNNTKSVINSVITTANNNSAILNESTLKKESTNINANELNRDNPNPNHNHHHHHIISTNHLETSPESNTPQNYRGLNNSVIISNYTTNQTQSPSHSFQPNSSPYNAHSYTLNSNILNDPNLNLAVTGHHLAASQNSPQQIQQLSHHSPLNTTTTHQQQLQQHQLACTEHWLNAYNSCAYDLSLNHPVTASADLTNAGSKEFLNLQLLSSPHSIPPHHTNPYYTSSHHPVHHLINPSNTVPPPPTPSYLHEDHQVANMRSNLTLYSSPYASHHDHHLHQHSLMGAPQTITASTHHTPSSIDEVIQDTLKDECLEDHHTGVSYLTLNSVVDVQSLKDSYHSPNLSQELTHLTAIAPAHMQTSSPTTPHHHMHAIHYIQHNNSTSSGANSPSPSSALSQSGDFTQLTNASGTSNRDIYSMLSAPEQGQMFSFTSPPSPVLSNR